MNKFNYLPHTTNDRNSLLKEIGLNKEDDLFQNIPEKLRQTRLGIPDPLTELEVQKRILELAKKNVWLGDYISFLGGGSYDRYIPSTVEHVVSRPEFLTAYTPYQPEISQGTLQFIYEYQSMICSLTGMDVSNASMYDVASAAAEAALMACRVTRREKVLIAKTVDPETQQVVNTYTSGPNIKTEVLPMDEGITCLDSLKSMLNKDVACIVIQMPNYLGNLEEVKKIEKLVHENGALFVVISDPISVGIIKPPGKYGADIVVGSGQSLGCGLTYGGPYFGFMACKEKYMRQMPGRIVGATVDNRGNKAFTLTLQTREQHIRREKATSNICSNHSLNALASCVYLSTVGPTGLKDLANICFQRAHYLAQKISKIPGFKIPFNNFFSEFVMVLPDGISEETFMEKMLERRILPGISISKHYEEIPNAILVSVTEKNSEVDLYFFTTVLEEISKKMKLQVTGK